VGLFEGTVDLFECKGMSPRPDYSAMLSKQQQTKNVAGPVAPALWHMPPLPLPAAIQKKCSHHVSVPVDCRQAARSPVSERSQAKKDWDLFVRSEFSRANSGGGPMPMAQLKDLIEDSGCVLTGKQFCTIFKMLGKYDGTNSENGAVSEDAFAAWLDT
jgi:hypothetical protein